MPTTRLAAFLAVPVLALILAAQSVPVPMRSRAQTTPGGAPWLPVTKVREIVPARTAIIVCDMWDKHWCSGATRRVGLLVERMEPVLARARAAGIQIVHAPSETMGFYRDFPQRKAMLEIPRIAPPAPRDRPAPPLPIDDSSGGCDTHEPFFKAWTRQHPGLSIAPQDRISDNGEEIYSLLKQRGINTILVMGVHVNMCILNRSFALKQMTRWGLECALVRDLTDSMYDPQDKPYVPHDEGTALVVEYIEKYWAPTLASADLLTALH